jgi:hypothetical protein
MRRFAVVVGVVVLGLAACGSSGSPVKTAALSPRAQAKIVLAQDIKDWAPLHGLRTADLMDAAISSAVKSMRSQVWPAWARPLVGDIEWRGSGSVTAYRAGKLGMADTDLAFLTQDVVAFKDLINRHLRAS